MITSRNMCRLINDIVIYIEDTFQLIKYIFKRLLGSCYEWEY